MTMQIPTFYPSFNQSQHSSAILAANIYFDWLKDELVNNSYSKICTTALHRTRAIKNLHHTAPAWAPHGQKKKETLSRDEMKSTEIGILILNPKPKTKRIFQML
jgi:hypothetical protein